MMSDEPIIYGAGWAGVPSTPLLGLLIQNKTNGEVAEIIESDDQHVWLRGTRLTSRSRLTRRVKYTTLVTHWSADVEVCPRCGGAMHRSSMGFACYRRDCRTNKRPIASKPNAEAQGRPPLGEDYDTRYNLHRR